MDPTSPIQELLACPACRTDLADVAGCPRCGAVFDREDGIPRLMPPARSGRFEVSFDTQRWRTARATLDRLLHYPPRHGADPQMPFRIDVAYADVVAGLPPGARVLEIGCGGGQLRNWLAQRGHSYVGTDVSRTRVQEWLQKFGGPDLLCDAHFLPFRSERFDLVVSSQVTEHLVAPLLAVQETFRVLKPGALFVGNGSFLEPWHDDSYFHMSPLGVLEMLHSAGFEPQAIWPGWSGFEAMFDMAERHLRPLSFMALLLKGYSRAGAVAREFIKRRMGRATVPAIVGHARAAGAINWIARKPV